MKTTTTEGSETIKHELKGDILLPEGTSESVNDSANKHGLDGLYFEWIQGRQNVTWKPMSSITGENKG